MSKCLNYRVCDINGIIYVNRGSEPQHARHHVCTFNLQSLHVCGCCFLKRPVCPGAKAPQSLMRGHLDGFGMLLGETSGVRPPPFPPVQMCMCAYVYIYISVWKFHAQFCQTVSVQKDYADMRTFDPFYQLLRVFLNSYLCLNLFWMSCVLSLHLYLLLFFFYHK